MQILLFGGLYDVGGFSTVMEKLGNKFVENGHSVTIAALMFKHFPSEGLYDVAKLPLGNLLKLKYFLRKFDVLHSHHPITNYLALICRRPFVYHYHGAPDSGKGALYRLNMFSSIKLTHSHLDAVIAVSEAGRAELQQHFKSDKIHVIYNGVETNVFKPGLDEKFRKGDPQFLFVGNLYEHKNIKELIFALKFLSKEYPQAYLQIIGNGSMYERLRAIVAKLGLEDFVELVGRVSNLELPYYYASCDVYITASRWELFGLPLLEAMSCGKPVVASSIPSHVELLTKSKAGEIYAVGNVESLCKKMIKIYEKSEKYRANAIIFAKEHDWSVVADRLSRIYAQIMSN